MTQGRREPPVELCLIVRKRRVRSERARPVFTARRLINRHGPIESFPPEVLGENHKLALLFKKIATLKDDAPLFDDVERLRWTGATDKFGAWAEEIESPRLVERCEKLRAKLAS